MHGRYLAGPVEFGKRSTVDAKQLSYGVESPTLLNAVLILRGEVGQSVSSDRRRQAVHCRTLSLERITKLDHLYDERLKS